MHKSFESIAVLENVDLDSYELLITGILRNVTLQEH